MSVKNKRILMIAADSGQLFALTEGNTVFMLHHEHGWTALPGIAEELEPQELQEPKAPQDDAVSEKGAESVSTGTDGATA